ncbi:two-component sensor histidine kinase [Tenacibaculum sp. Bg11-29]|uniref:sensor histidine kinase n=1 Tax=Tenacibaculum sp. Bg11-29 TaxID=2058306 RepID=UPI000C31C24D|nr:ATP-binding protein [Tenacibaculum sp. Bg11-29]PKH52806.1 two-component sensor histidine kinase [Tenacibaculum sp. Bg11-29]
MLKSIGKLEDFEIKNISIVFLMMSPGLFLYSILIFSVNPNATEIYGAREVLFFLFLIVGLLPFTKNKKVLENYGWITFFSLFIFGHYLIYTTYFNNFSLDYLLGTYVSVFGTVLLLKDRFLIIFFSATCLLHIYFRLFSSEVPAIDEVAILISMTTIFFFSFIILNNSLTYKKKLIKNNIKLEEEVKIRTKDLLERTNILTEKNKELEEFAYVISHDLKTPIRNVYTITQWLLDDHKSVFNEEINSNLQLIKEQSNQMELLVNGILEYSLQKKQGNYSCDIDLNKMLTNIAKANSRAKCRVLLKDTFPKVKGIEYQLLQVFQNLVQNAIKYNDNEEKLISIGYKTVNQFYQFSIEDNGIGIEEKYFEKIFKLFQKLEIITEKDSIGMGLALVKKIINTMGGKVWLKSKLGEGTIFYFTIPK